MSLGFETVRADIPITDATVPVPTIDLEILFAADVAADFLSQVFFTLSINALSWCELQLHPMSPEANEKLFAFTLSQSSILQLKNLNLLVLLNY